MALYSGPLKASSLKAKRQPQRSQRYQRINTGTVKLAGTESNKILEQVLLLLQDQQYYQTMAKSHKPYGDGKAAERIVDWLCQ